MPYFSIKAKICHININGDHIYLSSFYYYNSSSSISDKLCQIFKMFTSQNENSPYNTYFDIYFIS